MQLRWATSGHTYAAQFIFAWNCLIISKLHDFDTLFTQALAYICRDQLFIRVTFVFDTNVSRHNSSVVVILMFQFFQMLATYLAFCGMAISNAQAIEAYTREYDRNKVKSSRTQSNFVDVYEGYNMNAVTSMYAICALSTVTHRSVQSVL